MQYTELKPGVAAPDFELWDADDKSVRLTDFAGARLLLVFYRKIDTPGCARQLTAVQANLGRLSAAGISVLGVSRDFAEDQQRFAEKLGLAFPLLADEDHQVAESYGAWGLCHGPRKPYLGTIRSSVLVGADGVVEGAWYGFEPEQAVAPVLEYLGG